MAAAVGDVTMDKRKKTEMFSSPKAKRAEIEELLAIAQELTDAGYGDIWFALEENEEEAETIKNENI